MTRTVWGLGALSCGLLIVGCSGTTVSRAPGDGGTGGGTTGSGGAAAGGAGAGGAATGGAGAGGASSGGASSGGASSGGAGGAASGGAGGVPSCLTAAGAVDPRFRQCSTDADCTGRTLPSCCGSDTVVGLSKTATCSVPAVSCGGLGCAHFVVPTAEDGQSPKPGEIIVASCEASSGGARACRTRVAQGAGDAGSTACGTKTCGTGQLCIHPPTSVGGAVPPCEPPLDAGGCPAGTAFRSYCGGSPTGGCVAIYVPPPPFCIDTPTGCGAAVTCSCIPNGTCGGGADFCQTVTGHDVTCVNLAP
jgi:hypothetical protein